MSHHFQYRFLSPVSFALFSFLSTYSIGASLIKSLKRNLFVGWKKCYFSQEYKEKKFILKVMKKVQFILHSAKKILFGREKWYFLNYPKKDFLIDRWERREREEKQRLQTQPLLHRPQYTLSLLFLHTISFPPWQEKWYIQSLFVKFSNRIRTSRWEYSKNYLYGFRIWEICKGEQNKNHKGDFVGKDRRGRRKRTGRWRGK